MQTFMPLPSLEASLRTLDRARLGKERVETAQILDILLDRPLKKGGQGATESSWKVHPVLKMWRGYENALMAYYNLALQLFEERGYNNYKLKPLEIKGIIELPPWMGDDKFHRTHRSQLLLKAYKRMNRYERLVFEGKNPRDPNPREWVDWYRQFDWKEKPGEFDYIWPDALAIKKSGRR